MGCFSSPDLRGPCPSVERGDLFLRSKGITNPLRATGFYSAPTGCGAIGDVLATQNGERRRQPGGTQRGQAARPQGLRDRSPVLASGCLIHRNGVTQLPPGSEDKEQMKGAQEVCTVGA